MRWMMVCLGSMATGGLAILLCLSCAFLWLLMRGQFIGLGPNAWNPISAFGGHWELGVFGVTLLVFGLGCGVGFWFFGKRLNPAKR